MPPTYFPQRFSLDSYQRLWNYQAGLPTYLFNSVGTAFLTIVFTLVLTVPAGYALARFPIPGKEFLFVFLLLALIIPYQALLTPIFLHVRAAEADQLARRARHHPHRDPAAVPLYIMRNSFEAVPRELEEAAVIDGCQFVAGAALASSCRRSCRRSSRSRSSPSSPRGTSSSARW